MTDCSICAYAREFGEWPKDHDGTHCGFAAGCHRSFTSLVEAHCKVCHCHFSVDSTADLHEPYCTPEPGETAKRLLSARRKGGKPIFDLRSRKHGDVFIRWSPEDADEWLSEVRG